MSSTNSLSFESVFSLFSTSVAFRWVVHPSNIAQARRHIRYPHLSVPSTESVCKRASDLLAESVDPPVRATLLHRGPAAVDPKGDEPHGSLYVNYGLIDTFQPHALLDWFSIEPHREIIILKDLNDRPSQDNDRICAGCSTICPFRNQITFDSAIVTEALEA
jgi:hypothetical protein